MDFIVTSIMCLVSMRFFFTFLPCVNPLTHGVCMYTIPYLDKCNNCWRNIILVLHV